MLIPNDNASTRCQTADGWRQCVVHDRNQTASSYPRTTPVSALFERQVAASPDVVAIVWGEREVTYRELNRRANQLAHYLIRQGVGPEVPVGVALPRSIETVVALLGITKAGGAYVPLDTDYPTSRLAFMLRETRAPVVVTLQPLEAELPIDNQEVVRLDADALAIAAEQEEDPASMATGASVAYVMYTSGSTGRPKGSCIPHRAIARLVLDTDYVHLDAADAIAHAANTAFDATTFEIWGPLLTGGRVVVLDKDVTLSPQRFAAAIREQGITGLFVTTALFNLLADERPDAFAGLQFVLFGGEAVDPARVRRVLAGGPPKRLLHVYGPTENTTFSTWYPVQEVPDGALTIPIGRGIANTTVYVLDDDFEPARVGSPGELYVGGDGLALGYLSDPALTAEKFVPYPFDGDPGARLYRTGDRVCFLADGNIEFIGRRDDQVKVRGFRIEPGEIEAALRKHPSVRDAVVVPTAAARGGRRLVGYVVCETEAAREVRSVPMQARMTHKLVPQLRQYLEKRIPDFMVPSAFVVMDAFPLTPNGKVDRRALPDPQRSRSHSSSDYVAPRTPLENELVGIWRRALDVADIGIHDSFWELGGDSILAVAVVNELQDRMGEVFHIAAMFDAPTVAELAAYLSEHYRGVTALVPGRASAAREPAASVLDSAHVEQLRSLMPALTPLTRDEPSGRNPEAIFVLAPPRSGSSLLRIMLGGHPSLFAPPELELLSFNTLAERRAICSGRYGFMREGAVRAVMELRACGPEEAKRVMADCEQRDLTVKGFYRVLQEWVGGRVLVDKTATYGQDLDVLRRAEEYFDGAKYICLQRHPCGMIRSFEEARLDRVLRFEHSFSPRELGELLWCLSYENMRRFAAEVPADRQHSIQFEDLVRAPDVVMAGVCEFLGLEPHPDMVDPYANPGGRMTDGLYAVSRPISDPSFLRRKRVDPGVADRWKGEIDPASLGAMTRLLATAMGYGLGERVTLEPIQRVRPPVTAIDVERLTDAEVEAALAEMLRDTEKE